jgi:hypothetical protein
MSKIRWETTEAWAWVGPAGLKVRLKDFGAGDEFGWHINGTNLRGTARNMTEAKRAAEAALEKMREGK